MSLDEPLRSKLLNGDFLAGRQDDEWQVIPSAWVKAAQARWIAPGKSAMLSIGVDVAQGGKDETSLAPLYENNVFGQVVSKKGVETPDGPSVAALILWLRRDSAAIGIDTTGGWGGSARDHLKTHHGVAVDPVVFSASADGIDAQSRLGFANLRAKLFWSLRRALDPESQENVALPPGDKILANLTAPRWREQGAKILIESKQDIRKRLGSSTDEADAIAIAWHVRGIAIRRLARPKLGSSVHRPISVGATSWMG